MNNTNELPLVAGGDKTVFSATIVSVGVFAGAVVVAAAILSRIL